MVTEQQTEIAALELELAGKEKPCFNCGGTRLNEWDDSCLDCNGTDVVPLIAGSRRVCSLCRGSGLYITYYCAEKSCKLRGLAHRNHEDRSCNDCEGRKWIPDLDAMKVVVWTSSKVWAVTFNPVDDVMIVCQISEATTRKGIAGSNACDPYEALLRAVLAGIEAMDEEGSNDYQPE